ncbi:MAG TPA: histidine kinase N-terminal 7TM domain-containing protein [Longilinea sp.]|nr:histidine kinase N-terminal 7TM domain-containing protein [Longilinea sp.]
MDIIQFGILGVIKTISQVLTAGIAITAFSLLLYSFSLNLRDRVVRSFILILTSVVFVFTTEALRTTAVENWEVEIWLKLQWVGIVLLPAFYMDFSDALLESTGRPSRWRRRWAVRGAYLISFGFLLLLPSSLLVGQLVMDQQVEPYLASTFLSYVFTFYYLVVMVVTWINFIRAYRRTVTSTSRRRMAYLLIGATAPALGSFPLLIFGTELAENYLLLFWIVSIASDSLVGILVIVMAYAVSFFGLRSPDRVVKSRLLRWIMRGPVTAVITLGITTLVRRAGEVMGSPYTAWVPIVMVTTVVLLEYLITLVGPLVQRWLFYGNDSADLELIQTMEDRLLTRNDLVQFLEMILASICDRLQANGAYVVALGADKLELVVKVGKIQVGDLTASGDLFQVAAQGEKLQAYVRQDHVFIAPIRDGQREEKQDLLGLMVVGGVERTEPDDDLRHFFTTMIADAGLALRDRITQEQVFHSLQTLSPQVELIQQLRAAGRYDREGILLKEEELALESVSPWAKDALTHYWGGPGLTESPLLRLQVVQDALKEHENNPANALRAVLKNIIERLKPEGERHYTGEWLLYNILSMKFMEGKKVREIALKLAISEADMYRKQRVAIDEVAKTLIEMELQARHASMS